MESRLAQLIRHATIPPQSVIDLLKNTLIGTEGSKYRLLDTESKIHQLDNPHFFYIERNQKALGTITICERYATLGSQLKYGLYIRYFAFDASFHGSSEKVRERNSVFDQYWRKIFDTGDLGDSEHEQKETFFWGYIDPQNLRSFRMNERFGFESAGTFSITAFSRFFPKKSADVCKIKSGEKQEALELLQSYYTGYNFFSTAHLFDGDHYYVMRDGARIVAGIQAVPSGYKIESLPGLSGKFLVKGLPYIPFLRRVINPENFRFLTTEGFFCLGGYEHRMNEFLAAVLAENCLNTMLLYEDTRAAKIKSLPLKTGLLQRMRKNNEIHIVVKPVNLSAPEINSLMKNPVYLSGFDMT